MTKSEWEQAYLNRIPESQKKVFKKAYSGKSKAAGVKAKCLDCTCFQRKEVELCDVKTCPLWQYRPFRKSGSKNRPPKLTVLEKGTGSE